MCCRGLSSFAEGSDDEVQIAFTTHDVLVKGEGLHLLLADLAAQSVSHLKEAIRADRFQHGIRSFIREISVTKVIESRQ
jgi:hypothetical protein